MPNTFTLIASATIPSSQSNYTFSGIPSTFTHLRLLTAVRVSGFNPDAILSYLNGGSGTITGQYFIRNSGTTSASYYGGGYIGSSFGTNATSGYFNLSEVTFGNYASNEMKSYLTLNAAQTNDTTTAYMNLISQQSTDTNFISSITIYPNSSGGGYQLLTGTKFWLYGLKTS
jgi:hypothetical protein